MLLFSVTTKIFILLLLLQSVKGNKMTEFPYRIESKQLILLVNKLLQNTKDWKCDDNCFSISLSGGVTVKVLYDETKDNILGGTSWSGHQINLYRNEKPYMTSGWVFQYPICDLYDALKRAHEHHRKEEERQKELENSRANLELSDYISKIRQNDLEVKT